MKLSPLFALLMAAAAGTAFAQATSPAPDPANPPTTNPTPTPSMNPASPTANPDPMSRTQEPMSMQGSAPEDWALIKGHDKGYITKKDALPNSWLAQNFTSCDTDKDGKISETEYQKCQKRH
jgi:hypothetical protein